MYIHAGMIRLRCFWSSARMRAGSEYIVWHTGVSSLQFTKNIIDMTMDHCAQIGEWA